MLGNEAVARGLYEAGCSFVSSYPGTPSTEITEVAARYPEIYAEWAPNEKVAMEAAFGASLAGKRSFCGMKHVGLNVAADPLFTLSYTGISGGLVIGVADDPGMHSSQNEQDSRHYAIAAKLPMLEPADSAEGLAFARLAYELSEQFDTPVLLKMCTRVAHSQSIVELSDRAEPAARPYEKNVAKYVMMPGMAKKRHPIVEKRLEDLRTWAETAEINRVEEGSDRSIGIITSSTSYQYVKEACGSRFPVLKLGMVHPLPTEKIRSFAGARPNPGYVEAVDGEYVKADRAIHDFTVLEEAGLFSFIGIKTPGLTCAHQLALYLAERIAAYPGVARRDARRSPQRQAIQKVSELDFESRNQIIQADPAYGTIVCRCREVSEGEVLEAIRRGAKTPEGVKLRTGACMGRCQGTRCRQKIQALLEREARDDN